MIANLFARRVYEGETKFEDVPAKLKEQVRKILKEKYNMDV